MLILREQLKEGRELLRCSSKGMVIHYDQDFYEGAPYPDLLNYPRNYIRVGDWVGDGLTVVNSADDDLVINLSVQVQE